mmetsp:Transcript_78523/g.143021  ORF Transcript_78523/g.143021 Transcript_78523/m.143021 type:complete len:84 (+) Transcript_78523:1182-1433(+)
MAEVHMELAHVRAGKKGQPRIGQSVRADHVRIELANFPLIWAVASARSIAGQVASRRKPLVQDFVPERAQKFCKSRPLECCYP